MIELDGGGHYTEEQAEKDALRTKDLESMKLTVIRICNLDVDRNFRGVCEYIDLTVNNLSLSQLRWQLPRQREPWALPRQLDKLEFDELQSIS